MCPGHGWATGQMRCAGILDDIGFVARPQLAWVMIERAVAAGNPFAWFTADEACGDNGPLRECLEQAGIAYFVAVACDHRVPIGAGQVIRAGKLAAKVPPAGWQRISCGPGSKGEPDRSCQRGMRDSQGPRRPGGPQFR